MTGEDVKTSSFEPCTESMQAYQVDHSKLRFYDTAGLDNVEQELDKENLYQARRLTCAACVHANLLSSVHQEPAERPGRRQAAAHRAAGPLSNGALQRAALVRRCAPVAWCLRRRATACRTMILDTLKASRISPKPVFVRTKQFALSQHEALANKRRIRAFLQVLSPHVAPDSGQQLTVTFAAVRRQLLRCQLGAVPRCGRHLQAHHRGSRAGESGPCLRGCVSSQPSQVTYVVKDLVGKDLAVVIMLACRKAPWCEHRRGLRDDDAARDAGSRSCATRSTTDCGSPWWSSCGSSRTMMTRRIA
jgi:hypothetical protein